MPVAAVLVPVGLPVAFPQFPFDTRFADFAFADLPGSSRLVYVVNAFGLFLPPTTPHYGLRRWFTQVVTRARTAATVGSRLLPVTGFPVGFILNLFPTPIY